MDEFSITVTNPFDAFYSPTLGNSYSHADHHFAWMGDNASFSVETEHRLASMEGDAVSEGRIVFTPALDSILQFDGLYNFSWPNATIGDTGLNLVIANYDTDEAIIATGAYGGNFGLGPPFGTLSLHESVFLSAGINYVLVYQAGMHHYNPTPPGAFGNANGDITFTLTPVPEPAALALLLLGALALLRRSRNPGPQIR